MRHKFNLVLLAISMSVAPIRQSLAGELNLEESNALDAIREAGGAAGYDDSIYGTHIFSVDFTGPEFTDSTLEVLKAVPFLRELDLQGARVTNQGLVSLRGSTNLLSLDLQDTDVSDDGLQELKPLVNLRSFAAHLN